MTTQQMNTAVSALNSPGKAPRLAPTMMIASIALARRTTLVTHNTHEFSRVPGLPIVDWEASGMVELTWEGKYDER